MIRLMGLVDLGKSFTNEAELTDRQKKLDVDNDGKIEGDDLAKLRSKNENHGGDHEVGMAHNLLDDIVKNAMELKEKLGMEEKDIPAWIQDHISQAQNFISQANVNYHEYDTPDTSVVEKAPEGWEGTIKAMKKEPSVDNPWALAHWMKNQGYQSHKGN